jgi:hypothetical protein
MYVFLVLDQPNVFFSKYCIFLTITELMPCLQTAYNLLQYEVLSCVFPAILKDTKHNSLLKYLWHLNPSLTLRGFVDAHSDISCLLRIVDICQDLKVTQLSLSYAFNESELARQI